MNAPLGSLNDGAKRNRLPYLKIMYTAIRKIFYLPKFFAFFSTKIDSLTYFETHDCPLFCPNFLPFLAPKLIHLLTLTVMTTPYFPQIFCPFSTKLDSLTYFESHDYPLICPNFCPFQHQPKLIHLVTCKIDSIVDNHDYSLFSPNFLPFQHQT